jgi:hypothetical protein
MDIDRGVVQDFPEDTNAAASRRLINAITKAVEDAGGDVSGGQTCEGRSDLHRDALGRRKFGATFMRDYYDKGYSTEYEVDWALEFGSPATLAKFLKGTGPKLLKWMENRSSRSASVKCGKTQLTIEGRDDLKRATDALAQLQAPTREPS